MALAGMSRQAAVHRGAGLMAFDLSKTGIVTMPAGLDVSVAGK
jgi:hypothetical protein